mmetsp:Transcript_11355/g.23070  ORF Transcript_11355/g.23070 Transcript_11355/m.23070 type:complete len:207 (+) Transcript_11355:200-820(+)
MRCLKATRSPSSPTAASGARRRACGASLATEFSQPPWATLPASLQTPPTKRCVPAEPHTQRRSRPFLTRQRSLLWTSCAGSGRATIPRRAWGKETTAARSIALGSTTSTRSRRLSSRQAEPHTSKRLGGKSRQRLRPPRTTSSASTTLRTITSNTSPSRVRGRTARRSHSRSRCRPSSRGRPKGSNTTRLGSAKTSGRCMVRSPTA